MDTQIITVSVGYNPLLSLFIWGLNGPRLGQQEPLQTGFSVHVTHPHHSVSTTPAAAQDVPGSPCTAPALESVFSSRSPVLISENDVEKLRWGEQSPGVSLLADLLSRQLGHMCTRVCVHTLTCQKQSVHIDTSSFTNIKNLF